MTIIKVRVGLQGNRGLTGVAAPASITVANNIVNVNLVGASIADVNTVADNLTNIDIVAANDANVTLVGESIADVNSVGESIIDVSYVADNLAAITAAVNAAASATFYYGATGGSSNAFTLTTGHSVTLAAGMAFRFIANHLTNGNVTVNVDGTGVKSLLLDGIDQIPKWGIKNGQVITALYDGTNFQPLHMGPTTGDTILWASATTKAGWLFLDGTTTLAKTSGGTVNGAYLEGLWKHLYDATTNTQAAVSGGRTTRDADWTANKTLTLPETDNMSPYGMGTLAGFETGGALNVTPTASGANTGGTNITNSTSPVHDHYIANSTSSVSNTALSASGPAALTSTNTNDSDYQFEESPGTANVGKTSSSGSGGSHDHTAGAITVAQHSILHPVFGTKFIIKI